MTYNFFKLCFCFICFSAFTQHNLSFKTAYEDFPKIPSGFLEAVSYTHTRVTNITTNDIESCSGMPLPYGIMGLFADGKNYFNENGKTVGVLSGVSIVQQRGSVDLQVHAYAKAVDSLMKTNETLNNKTLLDNPNIIYALMLALTEIPQDGLGNVFAFQSSVYEVLNFMNDEYFAARFSFTQHNYNLITFFGEENHKVLSSKKIIINGLEIKNASGEKFQPNSHSIKSFNYSPALWAPAPSCNFSSRGVVPVSAITIHTVQGTYSGAISWAQNCNSSVSYHYVIRSSDGQVTQMVLESDKAWHVGSENPYTIGYEHEGYVSNPSWYTNALYQSSANLSKDIVQSSYGINPYRTYDGSSASGAQLLGSCIKIKGHQHFPNQTHTDPGIYWDWEKYYRLINDAYIPMLLQSSQGDIYDSGGANGNYSDDERAIWVIQPPGSGNINLSFQTFNLESGFDHLFIYDGSSTNSPIIGSYSGNVLPGSILSTSNALTIEFRSDCATSFSGWHGTYFSTPNIVDTSAPSCQILVPNTWNHQDFLVNLSVLDNESGVQSSFYNISDRINSQSEFQSADNFGFRRDEFEGTNQNWTNQSGLFQVNNGSFNMVDVSQSNSNAYAHVTQDSIQEYLYVWRQRINGSLSNQRAGMHFFCSDPTLPNRGNSYFVYFREETDKVQIYKVINDVFQLVFEDNALIGSGLWYNIKVIYCPLNGIIKVYLDEGLCATWQDSLPLTEGTSISFRSGGCSVSFDDLFVFKGHQSSQNITVGLQAEIRYQSDNQLPSSEIKLIAIDSAENWSVVANQQIQIDWSVPEVLYLNDGLSFDIDTVFGTTLSSNWLVSDPHSGIDYNEIGLGFSPLNNDVSAWNNLGTSAQFQINLSNPIVNTIYYFNLHLVNFAGLDTLLATDGQLAFGASGLGLVGSEMDEIIIFPNPNQENALSFKHVYSPLEISFYDINGRLVLWLPVYNDSALPINLENGVYELVLKRGQKVSTQKLIIY